MVCTIGNRILIPRDTSACKSSDLAASIWNDSCTAIIIQESTVKISKFTALLWVTKTVSYVGKGMIPSIYDPMAMTRRAIKRI